MVQSKSLHLISLVQEGSNMIRRWMVLFKLFVDVMLDNVLHHAPGVVELSRAFTSRWGEPVFFSLLLSVFLIHYTHNIIYLFLDTCALLSEEHKVRTKPLDPMPRGSFVIGLEVPLLGCNNNKSCVIIR